MAYRWFSYLPYAANKLPKISAFSNYSHLLQRTTTLVTFRKCFPGVTWNGMDCWGQGGISYNRNKRKLGHLYSLATVRPWAPAAVLKIQVTGLRGNWAREGSYVGPNLLRKDACPRPVVSMPYDFKIILWFLSMSQYHLTTLYPTLFFESIFKNSVCVSTLWCYTGLAGLSLNINHRVSSSTGHDRTKIKIRMESLASPHYLTCFELPI